MGVEGEGQVWEGNQEVKGEGGQGLKGMAESESENNKGCRDWYHLSQQVEGEGGGVGGLGSCQEVRGEGGRGMAEIECQKRKGLQRLASVFVSQ